MPKPRAPDPWLDRKAGAALVNGEYFKTSKRSVEKWPIEGGILLNNRVHHRESAWRKYAESLLAAAPAVGVPQKPEKTEKDEKRPDRGDRGALLKAHPPRSAEHQANLERGAQCTRRLLIQNSRKTSP